MVFELTHFFKKGEDDYYSQLTRLLDENERPLFKSLSIELCCPACRAKDATAAQCVHRIDMLPEWKSEGRHEKVKRIMASVRTGKEQRGALNKFSQHCSYPKKGPGAVHA